LKIDRTTIYRDFKELLESEKIVEIWKWKYSFRFDLTKYLSTPFFERKKTSYNFDFLANYEPNKTSFLWEKYDLIKAQYLDKESLSTYDYKQNIRAIENLIVDLSFSSSKLEWNTYSYLDTEILIKYNEEAEWKTKLETQMILNHKNAIKYIVDNREEINYTSKEFQNIHMLLWKWLLLDQDLWMIRNKEVSIWGSSYTPLDNKFQLEEQFKIFLEKLNQIRNPFEQALFILVFIPYFQLFLDINKRVSRISANIPLIKNWFVPFSFLQIKDRDYINAILAIYELKDTSFMRDLFVNNYLLNLERYI
jgi:Fic family protein